MTHPGTPLSSHNTTTTYIHLSATTRPSLALSIPPAHFPLSINRFRNPPIIYNAGKARLQVKLRPNNPLGGDLLHEDQTTYKPQVDSQEKAVRVDRLLQCDGVEQAMKEWDAEAIEAFVKLLDLNVIPFDEGDPMKPGLHVWTRVGEEA